MFMRFMRYLDRVVCNRVPDCVSKWVLFAFAAPYVLLRVVLESVGVKSFGRWE